MSVDRGVRLSLRTLVLGYLGVLLLVPVGLVLYRTFQHGLLPVWQSITTPAAVHAFWLTLEIALIAVPLNTVFGVIIALALVRGRFRGKVCHRRGDQPALRALAGGHRPGAAARLRARRLDLAALPGHLLAAGHGARHRLRLAAVRRRARWCRCCARSATSRSRRQRRWARRRWQTFWRITLPAIRWGIAYGVVLTTARAIGEFGAVSIVSGRIAGQTQTLTLLVEQRFQNFDLAGAYAASALLGVIAIATLLAMTLLKPRKDQA